MSRDDGRIRDLRTMLLIRRFEAALAARPDHGFQLFSSGEEAVAVGVCAALDADDRLLCSGRSIGIAIARGIPPPALMAELLGRRGGPCGGKGGRGHVTAPDLGFTGAHAVVAGNIGIAAGVALALQRMRPGRVAACVFGDGAAGAGILHETMNIAALWKLPLVLVCDNNQWSVSTARTAALAPAMISDLARPYGIPGATVDGMDVGAVREVMQDAVRRARCGDGPSFVECVTERFMPHSTGSREVRTAAELGVVRERCPIDRLTIELERDGVLSIEDRADLEREVGGQVAEALSFAERSPSPEASEVLVDVG